jgi:hypothetical protein
VLRKNCIEPQGSWRSIVVRQNPPTDKLLKNWIDATPAGFKFLIKANQCITHVKRLRGAGGSTSKFVTSLEPLENVGKLGAGVQSRTRCAPSPFRGTYLLPSETYCVP